MTDPCYCIMLRTAARRLSALYDEALAPLGITVAQFSLLRTIKSHAPLSLTELAQRLDLDRSTMGRNVRVLERLGLVRMASGADQREALVELSAEGQRVLSEADPLWDGAQARIEARMGREGVESLQRLLADV